jgi:uncharacterized protein (DUF1697 family)
MQYIALLRAINVGGNNIIKMSDLKQAFIEAGFRSVTTYLQSGNVVFDSEIDEISWIIELIKAKLYSRFNYSSCVIIMTCNQLQHIINEAPAEWQQADNLRKYIAFVRNSVPVSEVLRDIKPKDGVDSIKAGDRVLYLSTLLSSLTRSGFTQLIGRAVYKDISIRNFSTVQKLAQLCR